MWNRSIISLGSTLRSLRSDSDSKRLDEHLMKRNWIALIIVAFTTGGVVEAASGQEEKKWAVELEGGAVWMNRNDIRVPNDSGSDLSTDGFLGFGLFRIELARDWGQRHGLRFAFVPLGIKATGGTFSESGSFAGETFDPDVPTDQEVTLCPIRSS